VALIHIEHLCQLKDFDGSLEVAETLKVLEEIVTSEDILAQSAQEKTKQSDKRFMIRLSRKHVQAALDQFVKQLQKELKLNLERDNRSELHKIFKVY